MAGLKYKRVLIKLSGEALAGDKHTGIDPHTVSKICAEIADVADMGLEVALVIGGGNIFRGLSASAEGMDRSSADYMGMLATVLNSLALQDALEKTGHPTRVLSAITMQVITPKCAPCLARSYSPAPRFWLTKVVSASAKAVMGRKPKPSILEYAPAPAIAVAPNRFTPDWTKILPMEIMEF